MNRRDFLSLRIDREAELSCEQLYMRYLDSTLDGTTEQLFQKIEQTLSGVKVLRLTDAGWLACEELKPMESLIATFRNRGGRVE
jgi:hypothetical protein